MSKNICHHGVVESVDGSRVRIRTVRSSACDTCDASGTCHGHRAQTIRVDITDDSLAGLKPGDCVRIEMPAASGRQAVAVGFGLPLALFAAALFAAHFCGCPDGQAAMAAIGVLALYYLIIYMLRGRMERHFKIRIGGKLSQNS